MCKQCPQYSYVCAGQVCAFLYDNTVLGQALPKQWQDSGFLSDHFSNPSKKQEPVDSHHSYTIGIVSESTNLNLLTSLRTHLGLGKRGGRKEGPMLP